MPVTRRSQYNADNCHYRFQQLELKYQEDRGGFSSVEFR